MLLRYLLCEFLGTAFLLAVVVGSGILLHKIDAGNVAVTVFGISVATGCVLYALINAFGGLSAHFNPTVTLVNAIQGNVRWPVVPLYWSAQVLGGIAGVVVTNLMFEMAAVTWGTSARTGTGQWISEVLVTFGLIGIIMGSSKFNPKAVPQIVSAYVCGAIMFTSSTCFANPAVTIARVFTDTITGIRAVDVLPYIGCQVAGALLALALFSWLLGKSEPAAPEITEESVKRQLERELSKV